MARRREEPKADRLFYLGLLPIASISFLIILATLIVLIAKSLPALSFYGLDLFISTRWAPSEIDPARASYGLLPAILGTLVTAVIAVSLALPASLAFVVAVEEILPVRLRDVASSVIDVMAGLPTIVYGVWGLVYLAPALNSVFTVLHQFLPWLPIFSCRPTGGLSVLTAGVILAVMVIPFMFAIIKEAYRAIPWTYKEAALALGMTRYEYTRLLFSMIKPAVIAAVLLGFGRTASETVAVALVIGNAMNIPACIIGPGITVSSLIANQFAESNLFPLMQNALYAGGLVLLVIGLASNAVGLYLLQRVRFHG